jgi:hypothetical protein
MLKLPNYLDLSDYEYCKFFFALEIILWNMKLWIFIKEGHIFIAFISKTFSQIKIYKKVFTLKKRF